MARWLLRCAVVTGLLGCGGGDTLTEREACDELVAELCARLHACDPDLTASDEQACNDAFGPMCCAAPCDGSGDATGDVSGCRSDLPGFSCAGLASQQLPPSCESTALGAVY